MILFHKKLKSLRQSRRFSQAEMGEKFGVTQSAYGAWERETEPSLETLLRIADYFNVSVDDLLRKDLGEEERSEELSINERMDRLEVLLEKLADASGVDITAAKELYQKEMSKLEGK